MLRALSAKKNLFSVARMLQTLGIAVLPGAVHSSNPSSPSSGLHAHYQGLDDLYPNAGSDSDEDPELDNFSRLFSGTELQELNELSKSLRPTPKIYDDRCFALFLKDPRVVKVVSGWINDKQLESKDGYSDCKGDVFELAVLDKWCKFRSGIPNSHNKERMFVERVIMNTQGRACLPRVL